MTADHDLDAERDAIALIRARLEKDDEASAVILANASLPALARALAAIAAALCTALSGDRAAEMVADIQRHAVIAVETARPRQSRQRQEKDVVHGDHGGVAGQLQSFADDLTRAAGEALSALTAAVADATGDTGTGLLGNLDHAAADIAAIGQRIAINVRQPATGQENTAP